MSRQKQTYEDKLNVLLSKILEDRGVVSARGEYKINGRSDVIIHYQGFRIVLEGSYDQRDNTRVLEGVCDEAIEKIAPP